MRFYVVPLGIEEKLTSFPSLVRIAIIITIYTRDQKIVRTSEIHFLEVDPIHEIKVYNQTF